MKNRLHLSEQDWLKLRDYNKIIARNIQRKIPADWYLSTEDIEGAVYDSFISLLSTYKEGAISPTSYIYQYAESYTHRDLMREYRRIKNQLSIDDMLSPIEAEEGNVKSEIGRGDVQALTTDDRESGATQMEARAALNLATPEDKEIMLAIINGQSYDEIAAAHNISKMEITRRMRRYGAMLRGEI